MSNNAIQEYKDLYSQYVDLAVNLHNYHLQFMKHFSLEAGVGLRKTLKSMMKLEKKLIKANSNAYAEDKQNKKYNKIRQREEFALQKKLNPPKRGRPKKER